MKESPAGESILKWAVSRSPAYVEPVFVFVGAMFRFATRGNERRAVIANLKLLLGGGQFRAFFRAARVFLGSAWTAVDTIRADLEGDCMDWDIVGLERFRELAGDTRGAVLLTARMGSFSVANPAFAHRLGKPVFAVDGAEESTETSFTTDLKEALISGNIVAVGGDSVPRGHSAALADIGDRRIALPVAPFIASAGAGVPAYPFFIVRAGRRRYQLRIEAPLPRGENHESALKVWADTLVTVAHRNWPQWSVFEPLLSASPPDADV